ncbi:reverse transcriptase [Elysia marginata]|uniref:Reverse transcriptase n=1 Tax=Elysia marginata TaxID=1093978 RepID=A0AAV4GDI2_9GAST|nr:reverse transcriptase [Elysia marginata]
MHILQMCAESSTQKRHGTSTTTSTRRKSFLEGCDDWVVSTNLTEWDKTSNAIRRTTLGPDILVHSIQHNSSPWRNKWYHNESRMEQAHTYKKGQYLAKELEKSGYTAPKP